MAPKKNTVTIPSLTPVKSSLIESAGVSGNDLFIKFVGGAVYSYPAASELAGLLQAKSCGRYFARNIRGYNGTRVG